jgi:hypothetical protein
MLANQIQNDAPVDVPGRLARGHPEVSKVDFAHGSQDLFPTRTIVLPLDLSSPLS